MSSSLGEIRTGRAYEEVRGEVNDGVAELKRHRRVSLGGATLVFESPGTVVGALEEALRAERVTAPGTVADQAESFAALAPAAGELVACLYVDASDQAELSRLMPSLTGLAGSVYLEVAGRRAGVASPPAGEADQPAAVVSVRFVLDAAQREALSSGAEVAAGVDHAALRRRAVLTAEQCRALAEGLSD